MDAKSDIIGKTYLLYAGRLNTDEFYSVLSDLVESFLSYADSEAQLLSLIRKYSNKKRYLKAERKKTTTDSVITKLLIESEARLSKYFTDINEHLKNLTLAETCNSTLTTTREQYLLYILEIELVNRLNKEKFNASDSKYAFLPHCLHDLDKDCLSASDGTDYVCKSCSKNCSINSVSKLLKLKNIKAYIWREADLKKIFKLAKSNGQSIEVFGVACIPELINGLRLYAKFDVPAVGVPLDANRCIRWMGDFYPNSVNEKKILSLLN
ncbi:MAG: DUF116 domain-containing protein [Ignavibacteriaceae bacterium]|nr:DUF116 domain-containing protein [Ignavibacteriaceae bacterium]